MSGDSPHPRGWTRELEEERISVKGFPAPAGMDPGRRAPGGRRRGIPRTRGDGPCASLPVSVTSADSPHPRGWTRRRSDPTTCRLGFPAPAGMDPSRRSGRGRSCRIPRTRGDGPDFDAMAAFWEEDSPHPRGWTHARLLSARRGGGFPAPAGMDPSLPSRRGTRRRIPRTRGDGPFSSFSPWHPSTDSPHPRGWTVDGPRAAAHAVGFPAPAGMDLGQGERRAMPERIPRTRGDGPDTGNGTFVMEWDSPHPRGWTLIGSSVKLVAGGFPAPAGMDPRSPGPGLDRDRIPRTRGDGPGCPVVVDEASMDSPHPRGWTRPRLPRAFGGHGFPAPAGMDPGRGAGASSPGRIPRTRGDGPSFSEDEPATR